MKPVERFGDDGQRRVKTKSDIRPPHIVIDGLGNTDDVQPFFGQLGAGSLRAVAADTDQSVEAHLLVMLFDDLGFVERAR